MILNSFTLFVSGRWEASYMSIAEFPNNSNRTRNSAAEFERTPPQDVIAEQSVLGGMLLSKMQLVM